MCQYFTLIQLAVSSDTSQVRSQDYVRTLNSILIISVRLIVLIAMRKGMYLPIN